MKRQNFFQSLLYIRNLLLARSSAEREILNMQLHVAFDNSNSRQRAQGAQILHQSDRCANADKSSAAFTLRIFRTSSPVG